MSDETDVVARLDALEDRVEVLEHTRSQPPGRLTAVPSPERFWALDVLSKRNGTPFECDDAAGSVVFAGIANAPGCGSAAWQEEHPVPAVLGSSWVPAAGALTALGHPVRLEIVRRLLSGARTTQELAEIPDLGTSGQLYHHLRELQGAGLVVQRRRNDYAVPADRVVLCLVLVAAAMSCARVEAVAS